MTRKQRDNYDCSQGRFPCLETSALAPKTSPAAQVRPPGYGPSCSATNLRIEAFLLLYFVALRMEATIAPMRPSAESDSITARLRFACSSCLSGACELDPIASRESVRQFAVDVGTGKPARIVAARLTRLFSTERRFVAGVTAMAVPQEPARIPRLCCRAHSGPHRRFRVDWPKLGLRRSLGRRHHERFALTF